MQIKKKGLPHKIPIKLRREIYQGTYYLMPFQSNKLYSTLKLLDHINWEGQVHAFGDGIYDNEVLTYFDGRRLTKEPNQPHEIKELDYAIL